MMGESANAIPVAGPVTAIRVPPNRAAPAPPITAAASAKCGGTPLTTAEPSATGIDTIGTVTPAIKSRTAVFALSAAFHSRMRPGKPKSHNRFGLVGVRSVFSPGAPVSAVDVLIGSPAPPAPPAPPDPPLPPLLDSFVSADVAPAVDVPLPPASARPAFDAAVDVAEEAVVLGSAEFGLVVEGVTCGGDD